MTLDQLVQGLTLSHAAGPSPATVEVADLTDDSRQAKAGSLLVVRRGGEAFVADALSRGVRAVIAPPSVGPDPARGDVCWIACSDEQAADQALGAELARRFFDDPSRRLRVVGITGTKGKTTTAILVQHLLQAAGLPCGLIGTVWIDDGRQRRPAQLTTPGAIEFTRLLAAMVAHGCAAAVAEVSSHALHQRRVASVRFAAAVFTNLTGDHLDYHGTMDAYADAKAMLFEGLAPGSWAVFNADDVYAPRMAGAAPRGVKRLWTTLRDARPQGLLAHATPITLAADHTVARYSGPWGSFELRLPLVGEHNIANALQAIAAANCITAMARVLREAIKQCPTVPGRLEPVTAADAPRSAPPLPRPTVLVDYAHTHDALEKTLEALRPVTTGRLVCLFGCGGDRDRTKRPKMAAIACRLADRVVITSDNPRTEDPQAIIDQILAGVPDDARDRVLVEPDRAAAIVAAIHGAAPGDTVLLAGKGHETYQIVGTTRRHFDDREHAAAALSAYEAPRLAAR